jgi:hypothetical protein
VVTFPSTLRPGSYRDGRSDEQAAFSRRIGRRGFVAREVLVGAALVPFHGRVREPAIPPAARETPGGLVAEYREIRGLDRDPG